MPMKEARIMPPNTGVPTSRLASCEAPGAITSGSSPRMNANEVIMTGRKRRRAPSVAASSKRNASFPLLLGKFHDQDAVLRGQADQHDHADLRVEIERQTRQTMAMKEPTIPIVTDNNTGTGIVQLSYSATKEQIGEQIAKPRMIAVFPSARFS